MQRTINPKTRNARRGLSTLEMVLCLPILLFVMALMINYGTVAAWKVRALTNAREAVWSTRWPRTGNTNPRPANWPQRAAIGYQAGNDINQLDDPRADHWVVRGQLPSGGTIRQDVLDPTRGLRIGEAEITRKYPMLGKLGEYTVHGETHLLDDQWQHLRMGLASTNARRIPVIYELAKAPPMLVNAYVQAAKNILYAPFNEDLRPLDKDREFINYGIRFGWGASAPNFHPRLRRFCSLDEEVAMEHVEELIERIEGHVERDEDGNVVRRVSSLPERMSRSFIGLYNRVINAIKTNYGIESSPEISALEAKIDALNQFIATLQGRDGN